MRRTLSLPLRWWISLPARSLHAQLESRITITASEKPVFLACVAICRGEDDYLIEWLEFHRMMGVEHFFIYDNGGEPSTKELLEPYIAARVVSHIPFPDLDWPGLRRHWSDYHRPSMQELAYGHCLIRFRRHYRFLLKIDIDEFVFPAQERHTTLVAAMRELHLEKTLGIEIPMLDFGSSRHLRKPTGLVVEAYTKTRPGTRDFKSIGNARFIANEFLSNPHRFKYRVPLGWRLSGATTVRHEAASALFRLNHYFTKSLDEYLRKGKVNARGYMAAKENQLQFVAINADANEVENRDIQRFVPELRKRLRASHPDREPA